jgi:hypothetical protein
MGKIIGTCGHQIKTVINPLHLKSYDRESKPEIRTVSYCPTCERLAYQRGEVLETEEAQKAWLVGWKLNVVKRIVGRWFGSK